MGAHPSGSKEESEMSNKYNLETGGARRRRRNW
jgi:hypothetical protein